MLTVLKTLRFRGSYAITQLPQNSRYVTKNIKKDNLDKFIGQLVPMSLVREELNSLSVYLGDTLPHTCPLPPTNLERIQLKLSDLTLIR